MAIFFQQHCQHVALVSTRAGHPCHGSSALKLRFWTSKIIPNPWLVDLFWPMTNSLPRSTLLYIQVLYYIIFYYIILYYIIVVLHIYYTWNRHKIYQENHLKTQKCELSQMSSGKKGVKSHLTVHEEPSPTIKLLKNVRKKNKSCISEIFVW